MKFIRSIYITGSIAWILIFLWVYASGSKLMDFEMFKVQLGQSPLLTSWSGVIAWIVPAGEILIALLLFTEKFRLPGFYASFGLMVMFTAYIIAITRFSDFVPCSCGGILEKMGWNEHLYFNITMTFLAAVACILQTYELQPSGETENL